MDSILNTLFFLIFWDMLFAVFYIYLTYSPSHISPILELLSVPDFAGIPVKGPWPHDFSIFYSAKGLLYDEK